MRTETYSTTALRLAAAWTNADVESGVLVRDLERSTLYLLKAAGSGATCYSPVSSLAEGTIPVPLYGMRLVSGAGDVGAIAAAGGVGASDSDPILRGDANNSLEWSWANGAHVGAIGFDIDWPSDVDTTRSATLDLRVYSGATDAATMGVALSYDGGAEKTYSASDASTKSATVHTISATLLYTDFSSAMFKSTVRLTPPAHATDAIQLTGARIRYFRK